MCRHTIISRIGEIHLPILCLQLDWQSCIQGLAASLTGMQSTTCLLLNAMSAPMPILSSHETDCHRHYSCRQSWVCHPSQARIPIILCVTSFFTVSRFKFSVGSCHLSVAPIQWFFQSMLLSKSVVDFSNARS